MFDWFKKKLPQPHGPDFSEIDSQSKAKELFHRGDLEKLFLTTINIWGEALTRNT
jgi:hypothetical protein